MLIRTDSGGGTHEFLSWLSRPGRRLSYSIGFALTEEVQAAILALSEQAWTPPSTSATSTTALPAAAGSALATSPRYLRWPRTSQKESWLT
ncbi:hypothetical protein Misp03_36670 [Microbispora sp. NBRC 16548]|nr:hypothetical protein Misp03_36670 [Microbispora sp. NBRC 16548]